MVSQASDDKLALQLVSQARKRRSTEALKEYDRRRTKTDYQSSEPANSKDESKDEGKVDVVHPTVESELERSKKKIVAEEGNRRIEAKIRQRVRAVCCSCAFHMRDERLCCKECGHEQCAECLFLSQVRKPKTPRRIS
jgi:hypothetical protein